MCDGCVRHQRIDAGTRLNLNPRFLVRQDLAAYDSRQTIRDYLGRILGSAARMDQVMALGD